MENKRSHGFGTAPVFFTAISLIKLALEMQTAAGLHSSLFLILVDF